MMKLMKALREKEVLLGDGANGTMLVQMGFTRQPYDLANLMDPEKVIAVHRLYVEAGSDIIETNTFEANRIRLEGTNFNIQQLNLAGARLARQAANEDTLVLGAIGPCGKPIAPIGQITREMIWESVKEQASALAEGGVDGYILETFIDMDELRWSVEAIREVSELPIIVSKAYIEDGEALAEGLPKACGQEMSELGVVAVGANCIVGPQRMVDIVRQLNEATDLPILAFPTPGLPQLVKGQITYDTKPEYFAKATMRLIEEGARIVGGCCGTSPDHIRFLRQLIDTTAVKRREKTATAAVAKEKKPLPESEPTELHHRLKNGKFIVTVEMDLPRGLNVKKVIEGSRALKIRGADLIDISDGARARLRMNPLSVAKLIQDQVGIEVMMHFACRDRNLLAVQADLLGCHALGVRNILAITGDPANIGDYPSATSVFDVDAIGLVRILSRFNEGVDLAGYSIGVKCAYTIAVAFNPLAPDFATEVDRLKRKADAGCHVVYTQPIFEPKYVEIAAEECCKLGLPLFIGVLPLRSTRHAEFMHNEVPGITVPDWLRQKMAQAADDDVSLHIGIEEAQKLSANLKTQVQGLYLMPPFGNHQIAERVMDAVL
ncbi:MAG TPA: bifunctional homocysteine S-methyltransferase/methylenetetrahydrofolate reductase [Fimbriimonadaceae bacterium]|nr:bifunctional homocysteine S-methyltransferase/methylenetetrahydrofolate reductase [Fimbriimonadaceae bacterium]